MKPQLAQFASENDNVKVVKINIDQKDSEAFKKYEELLEGVEGIPHTVVLDNDGKVLKEFVGYRDAATIKTEVDSTR